MFSSRAAGQEDEYNHWYTQQHLGDVLRVQGFVAAQRFKLAQSEPTAPAPYLAVFDVESSDIPQQTLAQLQERAGTSQMPISPALDIVNVKTFLCAPISEQEQISRGNPSCDLGQPEAPNVHGIHGAGSK